MYRRLPSPAPVAALLTCLWSLAGLPSASAVTLGVDAWYENRMTGDSQSRQDAAFSGAIGAVVTAPTLAEVYGPAMAQSYADDTGTFWVTSQAGTIEPYETGATAVFYDDRLRTADTNAIFADVTGGTLDILDFGTQFTGDMFTSLSFEVFLNDVSLFHHDVSIRGRGGMSDNSFELDKSTTLPADDIFVRHTDSFSGRFYGAQYLLDSLRVTIDLTSIAIGEAFTIKYVAEARSASVGGETWASAWFRDPLSGLGGITLSDGLLPGVDDPVVAVPEPPPAALLVMGLAALGAARRRARRAPARAPISFD